MPNFSVQMKHYVNHGKELGTLSSASFIDADAVLPFCGLEPNIC